MSDTKTARAQADRAAAAATLEARAAAPQPVRGEAFQVTIASTGRPMELGIPADLTDAELLEIIGWMAKDLRAHLAARRAATAGGRIILPGH